MAGSTPVSVLYDYVPTEPDELELRAGDTLQVLAYLDDGWCQGYIDGAPDDVGLFPSNYVRKIEHAKLNSHLPPFRSNQADVLDRVRALHDYTPQEADELELHAGDIVVVTKEQDDGWCLGYVAGSPSVEGLFPANYVAPIETTNGSSNSKSKSSNNKSSDETSPPVLEDKADDEEDPYYMRNRRLKEVAKPVDEPALDEPPAVVASEASASDGYYDARGFYITAVGYYDTQGTFFPSSTPASTTETTKDDAVSGAAAGYYDEYGNYIVDGGYYDTEGLFHATATAVVGALDGTETNDIAPETNVVIASEADDGAIMLDASTVVAGEPSDNPVHDGTTATTDRDADALHRQPTSMDLPTVAERSGDAMVDDNEDDGSVLGAKRQSVLQLKRALEKAKRASERAEQARLQAERDMELELEARRKALQRQLDEEQAAKAIEASLHAQMHMELQSTQEAHAACTIQRSLRHHTFRQRHAAHVRDKQHKQAALQRQQEAYFEEQARQREAQQEAAARILQRSLRHRVFRRRAQQSHAKWQQAQAKKLQSSAKPRRYHSKVHVTAANRIQRATRDYLACKEAKATANELRTRRRAKPPAHAKARVIRPQNDSLTSSASSHSLLYASRNPSSSELPVLVPLFATDVTQISQLATLIANSVNIELARRLSEHDAHLADLTASMHTLQHVIEKHNAALGKVYDQNDRLQYTLDASPLRKRQVTKVAPIPPSASSPGALKPLPPSPKHLVAKQHRHPSPLKPGPPSPPKLYLSSPPKARGPSPPKARGPSPPKSNAKLPLRSPQHHTTAVVKPSPPSPRQLHKPVAPSPTQRAPMAPSPKLVQPSPTKTRLPQLRGVKPVQGLYYKKAKAATSGGKSPPRLRPPQGFSSKLREPPR
ncbi:hypothetical protein SPRG_01700 [Saprolegnia parasitica CBS 223.65]|uniref:SH3 domain-containing protein n=1 Tax=Saprolegnia parasitica (strain CBS 223.65) TaxID=695850 RepID=A0A067D540_SAPPC|nr:hypothetical protein SPRG_01700 [Saprolegnia parasitica CBS 223.65]KDO33821.1 hypothetical protein SPRG_01700 [Saprolegnia parasitica CBS 223.65]|eukprot:XP_012195457.1 hypothetical protein SPRG_01700 [Saprolegnia parasitica CBS 223.65]